MTDDIVTVEPVEYRGRFLRKNRRADAWYSRAAYRLARAYCHNNALALLIEDPKGERLLIEHVLPAADVHIQREYSLREWEISVSFDAAYVPGMAPGSHLYHEPVAFTVLDTAT